MVVHCYGMTLYFMSIMAERECESETCRRVSIDFLVSGLELLWSQLSCSFTTLKFSAVKILSYS